MFFTYTFYSIDILIINIHNLHYFIYITMLQNKEDLKKKLFIELNIEVAKKWIY